MCMERLCPRQRSIRFENALWIRLSESARRCRTLGDGTRSEAVEELRRNFKALLEVHRRRVVRSIVGRPFCVVSCLSVFFKVEIAEQTFHSSQPVHVRRDVGEKSALRTYRESWAEVNATEVHQNAQKQRKSGCSPALMNDEASKRATLQKRLQDRENQCACL